MVHKNKYAAVQRVVVFIMTEIYMNFALSPDNTVSIICVIKTETIYDARGADRRWGFLGAYYGAAGDGYTSPTESVFPSFRL